MGAWLLWFSCSASHGCVSVSVLDGAGMGRAISCEAACSIKPRRWGSPVLQPWIVLVILFCVGSRWVPCWFQLGSIEGPRIERRGRRGAVRAGETRWAGGRPAIRGRRGCGGARLRCARYSVGPLHVGLRRARARPAAGPLPLQGGPSLRRS